MDLALNNLPNQTKPNLELFEFEIELFEKELLDHLIVLKK